MCRELDKSVTYNFSNNNLVFYPTEYNEGLFHFYGVGTLPWHDRIVDTIKFEGNMVASESFVGIFNNMIINTLDLSNIDLSHVTNMTRAFEGSTINTIILGNNNLSSVKTLIAAFKGCTIKKLDLSSCNFDNLIDTNGVFDTATIDELILPSLPNVIIATCMFENFTANKLQLSENSFTKTQYLDRGFYNCKIKELITPEIHLPDLQIGTRMFCKSNISNLDLSNFHFRDNAGLWGAFSGIKTHKLKLNLISDSKIDLNLVHAFTNSEIDNLDLSDIDFRSYLEVNLTNCFAQAKCENVVVKSEDDYNILSKYMEELID